MKLKSILSAFLILGSIMLSSGAQAQGAAPQIKAEDLFARADYKALTTPQAKIELINKVIANKEGSSSYFSELTMRLLCEDFATLPNIQAKLDRFKALKDANKSLPSSLYDLENGLAVAFISTPEAQKATLPAKMAMINKLQNDGILSWPGVASIQTGLLAAHLAQDPAYLAADAAGKIAILRALETGGNLSSMTTAPFIKSVAFNAIAEAKDNQKAVFDQLSAGAGFFAESALKSGFLEFKK